MLDGVAITSAMDIITLTMKRIELVVPGEAIRMKDRQRKRKRKGKRKGRGRLMKVGIEARVVMVK
jgi:hypothetical protein